MIPYHCNDNDRILRNKHEHRQEFPRDDKHFCTDWRSWLIMSIAMTYADDD